jgi:hypothetical protein
MPQLIEYRVLLNSVKYINQESKQWSLGVLFKIRNEHHVSSNVDKALSLEKCKLKRRQFDQSSFE